MPIRERVFWVVLTVFGGIFGTGIYFLFSPEPRPMHLILTVIGAVGMAATLIERKEEPTERRLSILCTLAIIGLLVNLIAISFEIYDRRMDVHDYSVMQARWYAAFPTLPTTSGEDLTDKVVSLDGRRFENCTINGGTRLIYEGEKPFVFDCKLAVKPTDARLKFHPTIPQFSKCWRSTTILSCIPEAGFLSVRVQKRCQDSSYRNYFFGVALRALFRLRFAARCFISKRWLRTHRRRLALNGWAFLDGARVAGKRDTAGYLLRPSEIAANAATRAVIAFARHAGSCIDR